MPANTDSRGEHGTGMRVEQVVAPGDRGFEGPLTLRQVARAPRQQREPRVEALQERRRTSSLSRAAASSRASGRPSSLRQISSRWGDGASAGAARGGAVEEHLDGGIERERVQRDTRRSIETCSGMRLVTRSVGPGDRARYAPTAGAADHGGARSCRARGVPFESATYVLVGHAEGLERDREERDPGRRATRARRRRPRRGTREKLPCDLEREPRLPRSAGAGDRDKTATGEQARSRRGCSVRAPDNRMSRLGQSRSIQAAQRREARRALVGRCARAGSGPSGGARRGRRTVPAVERDRGSPGRSGSGRRTRPPRCVQRDGRPCRRSRSWADVAARRCGRPSAHERPAERGSPAHRARRSTASRGAARTQRRTNLLACRPRHRRASSQARSDCAVLSRLDRGGVRLRAQGPASSSVEPSTSVNRKVTVPEGRGGMTRGSRHCPTLASAPARVRRGRRARARSRNGSSHRGSAVRRGRARAPPAGARTSARPPRAAPLPRSHGRSRGVAPLPRAG